MWLNNFMSANRDLFPTAWSFIIFVTYMGLFVSQGLLVTASRFGGQSYPYNPTAVVLITEVLKLVIASTSYLCKHNLFSLLRDVSKHWKVGIYYLVPASLYCLYNNLSFVNLSFFDPTTYFIFMQIRLLMTGVIYQFLFQRKLSGKQWLSLLILTFGCMLQGLDVGKSNSANIKEDLQIMVSRSQFELLLQASPGVILILVQVCCSVFAGVYNEYIIKKVGSDVDIMVQNVYMYLGSILCNLMAIFVQGIFRFGSPLNLTSTENLQALLQVFVICIVINNSLVGIVTSLFLKNLNSILKAFASALELVFTAILSFVFLGIPIYWNTLVAVCIVSYSVVMYAKNPVKMNSGELERKSFQNKEVKFKKLVKFQKDIEDGESSVH